MDLSSPRLSISLHISPSLSLSFLSSTLYSFFLSIISFFLSFLSFSLFSLLSPLSMPLLLCRGLDPCRCCSLFGAEVLSGSPEVLARCPSRQYPEVCPWASRLSICPAGMNRSFVNVAMGLLQPSEQSCVKILKLDKNTAQPVKSWKALWSSLGGHKCLHSHWIIYLVAPGCSCCEPFICMACADAGCVP